MKLIIKDKDDKSVIERISIPFSQNPVDAILNWCVNCGYKYIDVEWEAM